MTLTLHTNPMSRGRIARWALEEIGQPYEVQVVAYGPGMQAPEFRALNPMGKVPVLVHDGVVVTECAAICAYLGDAFPQAGLAPPPGDPARGDWLRWLFFAAGPVEAAVTNRALGFDPPAEKSGFVGYGSYDRVFDVLEQWMSSRDHVAGGRFTTADIYLRSQIGYGLLYGTVPDRPAFRAWWDRISSRPACLRAQALDDALMPKESA
jgi:glutathione S-transferase